MVELKLVVLVGRRKTLIKSKKADGKVWEMKIQREKKERKVRNLDYKRERESQREMSSGQTYPNPKIKFIIFLNKCVANLFLTILSSMIFFHLTAIFVFLRFCIMISYPNDFQCPLTLTACPRDCDWLRNQFYYFFLLVKVKQVIF